ncbi:MAG: hypothetical protein ACRD68_07150 [Pyrinomonadaceae bacterium]
MLFLDFDAGRRIAGVTLSEAIAVFAVRDGRLSTTTDDLGYKLQKELAGRFNNSVDRLRWFVARRENARRAGIR